jgi:tripartite ATP-independent transporter DctM subunit
MIVLFVVFIALFLLGMDLFYAMTVASFAYLLTNVFVGTPIPLTLAPQQLMIGVDSFPLLAVPMFLLAGELMSRGGVTVRLVSFAAALVGHIRGGLAQVAVLANIIMSGMTGSAVADLAATGSLLIPSMVKKGYKPEFAAAVISSAATMGPIFPPSLTLVIIGSLVSVSVGKLFLGGVVPGLMMGVAMMFVIYRYAKREGFPVEPRATLRQIAYSFWESLLALVMPVVVLGSIVFGYATPTEASVLAVIYSLLIGLFVYGELKMSDLPEIFSKVAVTSAAVMATVAAARLFGWITAAEGLGMSIAAWLSNVSTNPYVILMIVNIVLLLLGMLMEPVPIILLTVPVLFPVMTSIGIDPVHFGVVVTLNLMIGCLAPPAGLNILVTSAMSGMSITRVARASLPFMGVLTFVLLLITYIPALVDGLPDLIYGK